MEANKILDTNMLIDGEAGLTTIFNIIEFPKALEAEGNKIIWPTKKDFLSTIEIMILLLEQGKPIPEIDVLLAAICINRKLTLVTRDNHFKSVKLVRKELSLEIKKAKKMK